MFKGMSDSKSSNSTGQDQANPRSTTGTKNDKSPNDKSVTEKSGLKSDSNPVDSRVNLKIENKYVILEPLGRGSFGDIYMGEIIGQPGSKVAVKVETYSDRRQQLRNEAMLYKVLGDTVGFPHIHYFGIYDSGSNPRLNILVMDLLGKTLEDMFDLCQQEFSHKTIIQLAIQLLQRFEYIHSKGIVYRDVKPENFLLGRAGTPNQNIVHIVDFGLSREYIDPYTKKHIPYRIERPLTGTARYMSINTHQGIEQSRRDDLQALSYLFSYFLRKGKLPWSGLQAATIRERSRKIGEIKATFPVEKLLEGHPIEFQEFLLYTRKLQFAEDPDYQWCKGLFQKLMVKLNYPEDNKYDWDGKYK